MLIFNNLKVSCTFLLIANPAKISYLVGFTARNNDETCLSADREQGEMKVEIFLTFSPCGLE